MRRTKMMRWRFGSAATAADTSSPLDTTSAFACRIADTQTQSSDTIATVLCLAVSTTNALQYRRRQRRRKQPPDSGGAMRCQSLGFLSPSLSGCGPYFIARRQSPSAAAAQRSDGGDGGRGGRAFARPSVTFSTRAHNASSSACRWEKSQQHTETPRRALSAGGRRAQQGGGLRSRHATSLLLARLAHGAVGAHR